MQEDTSLNPDRRLIPGVIDVNSINILSPRGRVDVRLLVLGIDIYESITSPFITGKLFIRDSLALGSLLPLRGEEIMELDLTSPVTGLNYKKLFLLYKMEGRENVKLKNLAYTLHFISIEGFTDMNCRISKKYDGLISDVVSDLVRGDPGLKSKKELLVEPTTNRHVFVSNFWTPSQAVYYLCDRAKGVSEIPSYVFFENREGFVFSSLERLYESPGGKKFTKSQIMRPPSGTLNLRDEYDKVLDMSTPVLYDYIDKLRSGGYGGTIYQTNTHSKRIEYGEISVKEDSVLRRSNLNRPEPIVDTVFSPAANLRAVSLNTQVHSGITPIHHKHLLRRMGALSRLSTITTCIQVYGLLDYAVGQMMELEIYKDAPEYRENTNEEVLDKFLSGKYLITALNHNISRTEHFCNMELSKF